MVIFISFSGGSEVDIEGFLFVKDIYFDLLFNNNFVSKDIEELLFVKESDQILVVLFSFKESSGGEKEVFFFFKEILFDLGFFVNIEDINEVDLVRLLFFKDMECFISFRVGIEGFLFVSDVGCDRFVVSLVVSSMLERVLEFFLEEKDDYEIFVKVKDIYEKSKKNKNCDKGEKEKKRDFLLRF